MNPLKGAVRSARCTARGVPSLLGLFLVGCAGLPLPSLEPTPPIQTLDPQQFLKMNLPLEVNGLKIQGMGVVPRNMNGPYVVKGKAPGELTVLTISSCAREETIEKSDRDFTYSYQPNGKAEASGCALSIEGLDKGKGRHTLGYLTFDDQMYWSLPATLFCGKDTRAVKGTAICQTREGLVTELQFTKPTEVEGLPECPAPVKLDDKTWRVQHRKGWCYYTFGSPGAFPEMLRLTTYGYEVVGLEKD